MKNEDKTGFAITSLILGIASIVLGLIPFAGIVLGTPGMIFGFLDKSKSGIRTAGIVTSIIGVAISLLWGMLTVLLLIPTA